MSDFTECFVAYDNPPTLANLSSLCIVDNIKHYVIEEIISDTVFYLWKDDVSIPNSTLEQLFQATLNNRGELDARWITLFLGSRRQARQLITMLSSPPAPDDIKGRISLILSILNFIK